MDEIGTLFSSKNVEVDKETGMILSSKSEKSGDIQRLSKTPKGKCKNLWNAKFSVLPEQKGKG